MVAVKTMATVLLSKEECHPGHKSMRMMESGDPDVLLNFKINERCSLLRDGWYQMFTAQSLFEQDLQTFNHIFHIQPRGESCCEVFIE